MVRNSRRRLTSENEGNDMSSEGESYGTRRARRNVSYIEDSDVIDAEHGNQKNTSKQAADSGDENSDTAPSVVDNDNMDENYDGEASDDDDIMPPRKRSKRSARSRAQDGEDSDFKEEDSSGIADEDNLSEDYSDDYVANLDKLRDKQFIATDDEDDSIHSSKARRRKQRLHRHKNRAPNGESKSSRRSRKSSDEEDESKDELKDDDSIQQEIEDLYDSSAEASPIKHKLREREKKIDYTIPSLLTNENENELYTQGPSSSQFSRPRGRRLAGAKSEFRNLLFPTAGPFGGSDVISLMGQNIPPGGIPIPGMTSAPNASVALGNDTDSSDDEFTVASNLPGSLTQASAQNNLLAMGDSNNGNLVNHTTIRGAQTSNKKKSNLSDTDPLGIDMNIDFSAVGGLDNYIDQLKEMVALPLLYPELYHNFAITPPRGVLFHGPPGTGKTLMARALAASCSTPTRKITFFMRKGADCLSKWVGEAERQLRLLFEEAKNQQPSIIFFDEIDGLAPVRSSKQEQIHASIVSTLLALMDGMDNRGQVIVIGATNRPDSVDPALRRPGRFDREFYFPLPGQDARKQILKIHTAKWTPPISPLFIDKVAGLTKGYGGSDLRALCTEAALNSIQRKYPQIYQSSEKLIVHPEKVKVVAKDFMRAMEKIVPSSSRSTASSSSPLPERTQALLQSPLNKIAGIIKILLPELIGSRGSKKITNLEEAMYLDPTIKDEDGGFSKHEFLRNLESSRVFKPYLLVSGERGSGQQYLGPAILNLLEGFQVQNLDLATIFSDVSRTPESSVVQAFIEARRHQPSVLFIPNIDTWFEVMPISARCTLAGLLRSLRSDERILFLGIAETDFSNLNAELISTLGFTSSQNHFQLHNPSADERKTFFDSVKKALYMKPFEFTNDLMNRPKRKLKKLKIAPKETLDENTLSKKRLKQQEYEDTKLKNVLKLKLAAIMDLFKNRYKRFKKPPIDDMYLHHLYEPSVLENPHVPYEVLYVKADDSQHANMLKELASGKYFYNMDLDTIEERIWNGFYSEAKQFMKDVRMIVKDSITMGDRERILKANEMLTNAQFGVDDFNNAEFANACKKLREREIIKQNKLIAEHNKLKADFSKRQEELLNKIQGDLVSPHETTVAVNGENGSLGISDVAMGSSDMNTVESSNVTEPIVESLQQQDLSQNELADNIHSGELSKEREARETSPTGQLTRPVANGVQNQSETDSSSEPEEDFIIEVDRELIIPSDIQEIFDHDLVVNTDEATVESLEHLMAKLMGIIWEERNNWDKSVCVSKMKSVIEHIQG